MITYDYKVKLIDFGFGLNLSGKEGNSLMKTKLGTPMYMAPEIEEEKPYLGKDVDIFALGATMLFIRLNPRTERDLPF